MAKLAEFHRKLVRRCDELSAERGTEIDSDPDKKPLLNKKHEDMSGVRKYQSLEDIRDWNVKSRTRLHSYEPKIKRSREEASYAKLRLDDILFRIGEQRETTDKIKTNAFEVRSPLNVKNPHVIFPSPTTPFIWSEWEDGGYQALVLCKTGHKFSLIRDFSLIEEKICFLEAFVG